MELIPQTLPEHLSKGKKKDTYLRYWGSSSCSSFVVVHGNVITCIGDPSLNRWALPSFTHLVVGAIIFLCVLLSGSPPLSMFFGGKHLFSSPIRIGPVHEDRHNIDGIPLFKASSLS